MNFFHFCPEGNITFGPGSLNELGKIAKPYGKKALLVTGKRAMERIGFLDKSIKLLNEAGIDVEAFNKVESNPTTLVVDEGARIAREKGRDLVVALGGGSVIDAAKAIAVGATHFDSEEDTFWNYIPRWDLPNPKAITSKTLPIIAVTSTSGTGSHITWGSVITNPKTQEKPGFGNKFMIPRAAIVDPEITKHMPMGLTATTGFDVLAHAMEAATTRGHHPIADHFAYEAIRLVGKFLIRAYNNGEDMEAREGMALADSFAGWSIVAARTHLAHALSHPIGAHFNTHHGLALAILSPAVMRFIIEKGDDFTLTRYGRIAAALGKAISLLDKREDALKSVEAVEEILEAVEINRRLSNIGVERTQLPRLVDDALRTMRLFVGLSPVEVSKEEMIGILESSF